MLLCAGMLWCFSVRFPGFRGEVAVFFLGLVGMGMGKYMELNLGAGILILRSQSRMR